MTEKQTSIPGKDASPQSTIKQVNRFLESIDLQVEETSWLNPAPHCWSVHLQAKSCSHIYTNGKGTTKEACLASGLGEFIERLASNFFFTDYYLNEKCSHRTFSIDPEERWFPLTDSGTIPRSNSEGQELLTEELHDFYNPNGELNQTDLLDNNTASKKLGICALPFTTMDKGNTVYFPAAILNNLYVSNGMAAGNSCAEATAQALSEIIERHVKKIIIKEGLALPTIPYSLLSRYPQICSIQNALEEKGYTIQIKDASLGGQFPVICVLLSDEKSGGVYAAFGANFRFPTAIERTLTELLQGRSLKDLSQFRPPCSDSELVADDFNIESHFIDSDGLLSWRMLKDSPDFPFTPWDFEGNTSTEAALLQELIEKKGFTIFRAEYLHYPLYCCRILVPGMSEIYPVDDLIYNNKGAGRTLRNHLLELPVMTIEDLEHFIETVENLGMNDQHLVSYIIGILFSENSAWHTLRMGELKAMLFLATGDKTEAIVWCEWSINYGELSKSRQRFYRLLVTLLSFEESGDRIEDYLNNLRLFYSETEIEKARSTLDGRIKFPDLNFATSWCEISSEHTSMVQIYHNQDKQKTRRD